MLVLLSLITFLLAHGAVVERLRHAADSVPPPRHVHLAVGPTSRFLHVSWASDDGTCTAHVHFGYNATRLSESAAARCHTYSASDMCEAPANDTAGFVSPGTLHDAVIDLSLLTAAADSTSVEASPTAPSSPLRQRVFYRIDGSATTYSTWAGPVAWSPDARNEEERWYSFSSSSSLHYPYSFVGFGDLGTTSNYPFAAPTMATLSALANETSRPINLILHVGDISYAVGNSSVWSDFMRQIEPVASRVPWMVAAGNHDTLCEASGECTFRPAWPLYLKVGGAGGECGVPYDQLFFMPGANGSASNRHYSFDHGPIHVVVISSEEDMTKGSDQYRFLDADLAAAHATNPSAWRVVLIHRPFYGSTIVEAAPERHFMREALEPILLRHGVDACLSGHLHQYQRTKCRIAEGKCDEARGVVYASIGTAGPDNQVPFLPVHPLWEQSKEHGVSRFDVLNSTHMRVSFVRSGDGAVIDQYYVVRSAAEA
jgi:hypothetical protein